MLIDCNVAAVTVSAIALDVIPFWVALMLLVPVPAPVTLPLEFTVATEVFEEFYSVVLVRFCLLPSLHGPVAVNGSVVPLAIDVVFAVMLTDCSVAAVTVRT